MRSVMTTVLPMTGDDDENDDGGGHGNKIGQPVLSGSQPVDQFKTDDYE